MALYLFFPFCVSDSFRVSHLDPFPLSFSLEIPLIPPAHLLAVQLFNYTNQQIHYHVMYKYPTIYVNILHIEEVKIKLKRNKKWVCFFKKQIQGRSSEIYSGSKDTPDFNPCLPRGRKKEPAPLGCPLTATRVLRHICIYKHIHVHTYNKQTNKKLFLKEPKEIRHGSSLL